MIHGATCKDMLARGKLVLIWKDLCPPVEEMLSSNFNFSFFLLTIDFASSATTLRTISVAELNPQS
jgi:hypothetical protein